MVIGENREQLIQRQRLPRPRFLHFLFDQLTEGINADPLHQDLDPRLHPVLPQLVRAIEDPEHRFGDAEVVSWTEKQIKLRLALASGTRNFQVTTSAGTSAAVVITVP